MWLLFFLYFMLSTVLLLPLLLLFLDWNYKKNKNEMMQVSFKCTGGKKPPPSNADSHVDPHTGVRVLEVTATLTRDYLLQRFRRFNFTCDWTGYGLMYSFFLLPFGDKYDSNWSSVIRMWLYEIIIASLSVQGEGTLLFLENLM